MKFLRKTQQGNPDLVIDFGKGASLPGALLIAACLCMLQGCTQAASTSLQDNWLSSSTTNTALYETDPLEYMSPGLAQVDPFRSIVRTYQIGSIQSPQIGELSGLVASRRHPGTYWATNDSGNKSQLFAFDRSGRHIGSFEVPVPNRDWEDLSAFEDNGTSWLMIADTGDNLRQRKLSTLYFFKEPDLGDSGAPLVLHHKVDFSYEGGPENVESVSVSVKDRAIYLVGKGAGTAGLYSLPLDSPPDYKAMKAIKVGNIDRLPWSAGASWWEQAFASRVLMAATSMDFNTDETLAVIGNYRYVYLFRREPGQSWSEALSGSPQVVSSHRLAQSETVAFNLAGDSVLVGSEGRYAPILLVRGAQQQPL